MTKHKKLRHSEYYDLQDCFDKLYAKSKQGDVFTNLIEIISSEENIRLAYRNIKRNLGSHTSGVDKLSIRDVEKLSAEKLVEIIQRKFKFYKPKPVRRVEIPKGNIYSALRKSRLKEMYIVRYADDFKIFCRKRSDADKVFIAIKQWLKDRLSLEISEEKSKVVNLKRHYSEFLGFKLKAVRKGGKFVVRSHMSDKALKRETEKLKAQIINIEHSDERKSIGVRVNQYNLMVMGIHNYYRYATKISSDCSKIQFIINTVLHNRLRKDMSDYENGICAIPSDALIMFADYYKATTDYILGLSDNSSNVQCTDITDDEYSKLMALRSLSSEQKLLVEAMIKAACTVIK